MDMPHPRQKRADGHGPDPPITGVVIRARYHVLSFLTNTVHPWCQDHAHNRNCKLPVKELSPRDFPGGPVAKTCTRNTGGLD